jgi:membrane fusion protein, copper/silver efflux system
MVDVRWISFPSSIIPQTSYIIKEFKEMKMNKIKNLLMVFLLAVAFFPGCSKQNDQTKNAAQTSAVKKEYWTCTMHPQVHMDRPGSCPICGMDLVKRVEGAEPDTTSNKDAANMISLNPKGQILANITTIKVKKEKLQDQITAYSYMDFVENNRKTISARFNGRIEKLFVDKTGDYIKKGQPLFEIYSPDLVQAQNDYIVALQNSSSSSSLLQAAEKKLEIFGMTPAQIQKLETTKEAAITVTYYSPVNGTVIEKKIQEGDYVNEGTVIYNVADLSTVWNIAEVYENDLKYVKVGNPVKLHLRAYPGEEYTGRISFIYPVIDPQTRTVKVRSEFTSLGGKLKPQMYGETVFSVSGGEGILVPADAVIIAGKRAVVWTKTSGNMFEAKNVLIGNRFGDKYQIVAGLNEGDEIAATGGFLIDSESQLKSGTPSEHQHSGTQQQKKKPSSGMEGMQM